LWGSAGIRGVKTSDAYPGFPSWTGSVPAQDPKTLTHINKCAIKRVSTKIMMLKTNLLWAFIPTLVLTQELQPLPSGYPATNDVVYLSNNLAVIPPPFNYTGFLLNNPFTTLNVSNATTESDLQKIGNATFVAFDPRFFDVIGTAPKVEVMFNITGILFEAPAYVPDQNILFFSMPGSYSQYYIDLAPNPPTLHNVSFNPVVFGVNGARYSTRDKRLYLAAMGGNGTVASIWSADPKTWESKTLVNNYRGLHLNSPDDVTVSNNSGLVYFTDPTYAYVFPPSYKLIVDCNG
jgi:hypothetical protein